MRSRLSLLAHERAARLVAAIVVGFAALVFLGTAIAVLRVVVVGALVLAAVGCVWLVYSVWKRGPGELMGASRAFGSRVRLVFSDDAEAPAPAVHDEPDEAAFAAFRRAAEALTAELLARQARLTEDAEHVQRELAAQIETMRALVTRIAQFEQDAYRLTAREPERTILDGGEPDVESVLDDLEADLRLEKIAELEQTLGERERHLERRERELAAFVAETQSRLS